MGLSYPGIEMHSWGSSEEMTALNFHGRQDILKPVKLDWYDTLTEAEKLKFTDDKTTELEVTQLTKQGRARNVRRYRQYLYKLKDDIKGGKRPEVKSIFLDNLTPFMLEFEDYIEVVFAKDFITKDGNFDTISFYKRLNNEVQDFIRLFMSIECNTLMSCHIAMVASEELSANTQFMTAAKMGGVKKEWQPNLTGKVKFVIAGIPDWVFFLKVEESAGQPTKHIAKLEADETNIGAAKSRFNPFDNPRRIEVPRNDFYNFFTKAIESKLSKAVGQGS